MELTRTCENCKASFTARTVRTRYCSHRCNSRHYKILQREEKIRKATEPKPDSIGQGTMDISAKLFLSVEESASVLGMSRRTIERLIKGGQIKAVKLGRRTIIARQTLDNLFQP